MSIVLTQEFVSSEEAYITWTIDQSILNPSSKGFLYLTDVTLVDPTVPPSGNAFPITKYQLRFSELSGGSHVFEGLKTGSYIAELSIIIDNTSNTSISSQPITVNVYNLEAPIFNIIVSSDNSFIITLAQPIEPIKNVTFILLGKLIINGELQSLFDNTVTICLPYSAINLYVIGNVVNNRAYEIACFYTDIQGTSSVLSETRIETPTNSPNRIAESAAIYDSVGQTLTITHNMPSNAADYDLIDCRATITNTVTNAVTYYYSSENSALLVPAPTAADSVVFNMNNQSLLPVDAPFTVTLSVKNELELWGPVESPALYCIHSADYFAVSLVASDLSYSVGLNSITTSDNSTYVKNPEYVITYIADVFECNASGAIVGAAVASLTQDNINFVFAQLVAGLLYKLVVNLKYDYTFVDTTSATIGEKSSNTCFYYFIPHDIPLELNLFATPSDGSVYVSWPAISTSELSGFNLDYYEVSSDNATWISNGTATSYLFTGLSNGSSNIFYARAVSDSGSSLYMSGIDVIGKTVNITSVPYGASLAPTLVGQVPGDSKCTVVWTNPATYNGGEFKKFQASVNEAVYVDIVPSFASDQYTYVFESLTNLTTTSIKIQIVTNNVSNSNNVDTTKSSLPLSVSTIPFKVPDTPAGFVASPSATAVKLDWDLVVPTEIINNDVQYELHYKLATDSDFTIVSDITTNTYSVTGLTSNLMYDFKIRSTILNDETSTTFESEFTEVIPSRPFVYSFPPNMTLVAGNASITVKLSPNSSNYFQGTFKYHATISEIDGTNSNTATLSNISNTGEQSITFSALGNSSVLVNLLQYKIIASYEMLNTDNERYYESNTTTNLIEPYNSVLAPVLDSVSHDKMISLSLDIAAFNGYDITGYQISFDNVSWAPISMSSTVELNVFTADITLDQNGAPLVNGSEYHLYARIQYIQNETNYDSVASNMVTNIPYTTASAPTNLTSEPGNQQVTLSWSAPSNLGGLGLDHYEVKMDNNNWLSVGTAISYTFTELTNGQTHTFFVLAVTIDVLEDNALVNGASASSVNIPYAAASAPIFVSCAESDTQLVLTWSEPSSLGGLTIHHYEVSSDDGLNWVSTGTVTSKTFTGLVNGQEYMLRVKAFTTHPYLSALVEGAALITPSFYPYKAASAPIFVSCVEGDTQLVLTWSEPSSLGGLEVEGYEVSHDDGLNWVSVMEGLTYTFTGLVNGQEYMLRVKAFTTHMNLGNGSVEGAALITPSFYPYKAASAPIFVSCVEGDTQLVLTWSEPSSLGGLNIHSYEVSHDGLNWVSVMEGLTYTFTGLVNGQEYMLKVRAVTAHPNLGSIIGATLVTESFYPYKGSAPPQNLTSEPEDGKVVFNWTAADATINGLPFVTYQVSVDNNAWTDISTNTYSLTGENGVALILYVRFVTEHPIKGLILSQNASDTNIPYSVPSQVDSANYDTDITNDNANLQLVFSWGAVSESQFGGLPFHHYAVSKDAGVTWVSAGSNLTYTFLNLTNGQTYLLLAKVVVSHQYKGLIDGSFDSNNAYSDIPYAQSAAPVNIVATPGDKSVSFTWDPVADFGGLAFKFYYISINPEEPNDWKEAATNSYSFINLTNGQNYTFTITAITNHPRHGPIIGYTSEVLDIVPYALPAAPVVTTVIGDEQIALSWATPDLSNLSLYDYRFSRDGTTWFNLSTTTDPNVVFVGSELSSSVTFIHLTNGQTYNYSIASVTSHPFLGLKTSSSSTVSGIPFGTPGPVSEINAYANNNYLNFDFIEPDDTNHEVFTQYYEYSIDDSVTFNSLSQLTYFTTYIENIQFTLGIRCYIYNPNDSVTKIYGNIQQLTDLQNINVSTPQNLQAEVGNGLITLSWASIESTTFQVIRYYSNGSTFKAYTNAASYIFSGLDNGETYEFGVNMYVNGVAGPVSNISATPMSKPIINSVSKSGDNLLLNIDWGGSAKINVNFGAFYVINNIINGTNVSTVVGAPPVYPITFTGMSAYNYFNVTISNSVGSTSGFYTI